MFKKKDKYSKSKGLDSSVSSSSLLITNTKPRAEQKVRTEHVKRLS